MSCRQENFEECESACAYHGITDFVTNMLMKVREQCSRLLCTFYGDLDLEFTALSRQT